MNKIFYKRTHLLGIFLSIFFLLSAGVNPRSDLMIKKLQHKTIEKGLKSLSSEDGEKIKFYPFILEIEANADDVLEELGAVVFNSRGNLYLTCIPVENLDRVPSNGSIINYHVASVSSTTLDVAREVSGVNKTQLQLKTLTGDEANVVTGICDIGFDPRHPAFAKVLRRWTIYDEFNGKREVFDGYNNIVADAPVTDNENETHATHVGNILCGAALDTPYYGVAPNTDFVATVSRLTDVGLCAGIEDIVEYAKEVNKPAVVNLSVANFTGPHDGTDLVGRYLSELSKDITICFSAGNFGSSRVTMTLDLDDYNEPIGSGWCDMSWLGFHVHGATDLWSRDDKSFEFRIIVSNDETGQLVYATDWLGGDNPEGELHINMKELPWFTDGELWAEWGTSETNGRFNVALDYEYESEDISSGTVWAKYFVGFHVRKVVDNTRVYVYNDGVNSFLHSGWMPNIAQGNGNESINNLATSPDVVAIGAWQTRCDIPDIIHGSVNWNTEADIIAPWTSVGTTVDGRKLPHFSAPGSPVISAMSAPFASLDEKGPNPSAVAYAKDGHKYFAMQGTSMASPFAAGVFALWLQVNPDLTRDDLVDIACKTAKKDFVDITDRRWGAGAIDAYAGLQEIYDRATIDDVIITRSEPHVIIKDAKVYVEWPGVNNPGIEIYDMTGRRLSPDNQLTDRFYLIKVSNNENGETFTYKLR